ncbi:MAG: hypothetical protein N2507_05670 [Candidatus Bipolaricaulota bacterium]|nr:hypothetical protein [Candidatus Bipolaricaulota bacterium]
MRGIGKRACLLAALLFFLGLLSGCFLWAPPAAPTHLSASDGEYQEHVLLTWSAVPRAARYEVFRAEAEDGDYEKIGETEAPRFLDVGAAPNVLYWYRVRACNPFGCSAFSAADAGFRLGPFPPPPPRNLQASDGTFPDRIRLTWSPAPAASYYKVWRSDIPAGDYLPIAQVSTTSYEDREVVRGRVYWYKVQACNDYGCGDFSPPDFGAAALQPPGAPPNVQASDGVYADRVRVSWGAVAGAARYEVWRAAARDGPYELLAETTATSYDDRAVTVGTTYWYKVRAWNVLGHGPFSEPDSGYAAAGGDGRDEGALPGQPRNVQASDGAYLDRIRVTWDAVPGAKRYEVLRSDTGREDDFVLLATVTATSYDDVQDVALCVTRWYKVRACHEAGCGPASVADSGYRGGTLAQVTGLSAAIVQTSEAGVTVKLQWNAVPAAQELQATYEIWRTEPGVAWRKVDQSASTTFSEVLPWSPSPLGTTYRYKVRAVSGLGCVPPGAFSAEVAVTVLGRPTPGGAEGEPSP